jgi:hypothetical protein
MKYKMTDIPHPPYSPDLASCYFILFPKNKLKMKGRWFDTLEEIQAESQRLLDTPTENEFPGSVPKTARVGPVSICRRELL